MTIKSLYKFRDDGKIVPSTMSGIEMLELGWGVSLVKKITWTDDEVEHRYQSPYSLTACVVPGERYVAVVESTDEKQSSSLLRLISGDGRSQVTVPNTQQISGRDITGQFEWFNLSASPTPHVLEIVFRPVVGSDAYSVGIDAATGKTVSTRYIRA